MVLSYNMSMVESLSSVIWVKLDNEQKALLLKRGFGRAGSVAQ